MKPDMDDVPLVASEGVGSGGVGHYCSGKVNVFRLPPPIPGKEGGGYPSEWHHAQIVIRRNYMIHKLRNAGKKIPEAQDPKAESDPEAQKAKMRKRDLIKKYADSGLNFIKGVADKVSHNETLQKTAGRVGHAVSEAHAYTGKLVHGLAHKKHDKSGETAEDVQGEEANRYPGWMMERIKTASIGVGFFLKRREHGALSSETPFQLACKQERVQIIEIAARDQLKTTHVVQNGDVLKWIFAAKAHDVAFQVKIRKMMEVGGANEEVLVPTTRVDSKSIAEGTYEVTEAGQVVVVLDNSYSLLTSKTIAYRTWVEKAAEVEGGAAKSSASESIQQDDGIVELSPTATEEGKPAADAAQENSEKAGAAKQAEEEAAAKKAEEEEAAAAAAKKAEEEAAAAAKKAEEEAAAAAAKKAEEEAAAAKKAEEAAAAAKKAEEEAAAAAAKKAEEEAAAAKKAEEEAAAAKKAEEEAATEEADS